MTARGRSRIATRGRLAAAFEEIGRAPAMLEGFVTFDFEVSVLLVRGLDAQVRFYDIPVNRHRDGILAYLDRPLRLCPSGIATERARSPRRIADALDYVGVLAVEMFYVGGDAPEPLIVNEMAPRVHNSGHWTIDACAVSQFENHIRAVAGWPLGATERHSNAEMHNLIGAEVDDWPRLAADPAACVASLRQGRSASGPQNGARHLDQTPLNIGISGLG